MLNYSKNSIELLLLKVAGRDERPSVHLLKAHYNQLPVYINARITEPALLAEVNVQELFLKL